MSSGQNLTNRRATFDTFEFEVYERSKSNIRRLKDRLPDDHVANLAREVIRRVVSKGDSLNLVTDNSAAEDLEELALALIAKDDRAGANLILKLRSDGKDVDTICLKHLSAAAQLLGDWWEEDRVDFTQVTLGTVRIFAILRSMRHLFEPAFITQDKSALFASVPGENHTLGVRMAADLFRKDGWDISLKVGLDHDALVAEIEQTPNCIIGLSISGQHSVEALSKLVVAIHISCPHAAIFVSGQNIAEAQPYLDLMGLDGVCSDIEEAKELLARIWSERITAV